jgi:hypothetical protein
VAYFVIALISFVGGGLAGFFASEPRRRQLAEQQREQQEEEQRLLKEFASLNEATENLEKRRAEIQKSQMRNKVEFERLQTEQNEAFERLQLRYQKDLQEFEETQRKFDGRVITLTDLQEENTVLKSDLRNLDMSIRKSRLDRDHLRESQLLTDEKVEELGERYLKENVKWISVSLTPNNFAACKQRLQDVISRCRGIGFEVSGEEEEKVIANLKEEYQRVVRAAFEREEQARIKAQIREEVLREKEIERELKQLEREREAIQNALTKALAEAKDQHSEEIERLRLRLSEAESKQRAISQAQITKAGYVYVISNIGSFGEGVVKVGMTRRVIPMDRVRELGDASVPFPFDVHMMISTLDAPGLENALHRKLHKLRVNKTNPRKEFFRVDLGTVHQLVTEHHGEVEYFADAEALQYRQSLFMSDADEEFIEKVYEELEEEGLVDHEDD